MNWIVIILYILRWIFGGDSREEAVGRAAAKFHIDEDEIWRHGGF